MTTAQSDITGSKKNRERILPLSRDRCSLIVVAAIVGPNSENVDGQTFV